MGTYRYLDDVAIADAAFEARGATLSELFATAAEAVTGLMVDPATLAPKVERQITLSSDALDRLLYDWLSELVVFKDSEQLLFARFDVAIHENGGYRLEAVARGETIDPGRHRLRSDVKAITFHLFEVRHDADGCFARVVVDI